MKTDKHANAAFLLFHYKGWEPNRYYGMKRGQRTITRVFLKESMEIVKEEMEWRAKLMI